MRHTSLGRREEPLRRTPPGRRAVLRGVLRREEAGPLLRRPASLVARAPMAGARLSTGWQLRHEGFTVAVEGSVEGARGSGVVGGLGEPRHVRPALPHRDALA